MSITDITAARLTQLGAKMGVPISSALAATYAPALEEQRDRAELDTPLRVRHFIAQIAHETGGFRKLVESTKYSNAARLDSLFSAVNGIGDAQALIAAGPVAIGNRIYAGRLGNGNEASGDGYRYRGRGFIMITGRGNYAAAQQDSGLPLVAQPELLGLPDQAAIASTSFWKARKINDAADRDKVVGVTLLVNGPKLVGLDERRKWLAAAATIWA